MFATSQTFSPLSSLLLPTPHRRSYFFKEQVCGVAFFLILLLPYFLILLLQTPWNNLFFCRLLVGAPREKAFPSQQANRTGGLYSCDITSPNTGCTRVVFDEESKSLSTSVLGCLKQLPDFSHLLWCLSRGSLLDGCFCGVMYNFLCMRISCGLIAKMVWDAYILADLSGFILL